MEFKYLPLLLACIVSGSIYYSMFYLEIPTSIHARLDPAANPTATPTTANPTATPTVAVSPTPSSEKGTLDRYFDKAVRELIAMPHVYVANASECEHFHYFNIYWVHKWMHVNMSSSCRYILKDYSPYEGKTCALVGNSPTILLHEYGSSIDDADVVIRHNGVNSEMDDAMLATHLGRKTTLQSGWAGNSVAKPPAVLSYGIYGDNDYDTFIRNVRQRVLVPHPRVIHTIYQLHHAYAKRVSYGTYTKDLNVWPSTGMFNIFLFSRLCSTLDVYGFSGDIMDGVHELQTLVAGGSNRSRVRKHVDRLTANGSDNTLNTNVHAYHVENMLIRELVRRGGVHFHGARHARAVNGVHVHLRGLLEASPRHAQGMDLSCIIPLKRDQYATFARVAHRLLAAGCDAVFLISLGRFDADDSRGGVVNQYGADEEDRRHHDRHGYVARVNRVQLSPRIVVIQLNTHNASDSSEEQWRKTRLMFMHIGRFYANTQWYVKIDTDTVFIPENFRAFLRRIPEFAVREDDDNKQQGRYMGHVLRHNDGLPINAGGCYALNKMAITKMLDLFENQHPVCEPRTSSQEDVHLALCLAVANVTIYDSRDPEGREYFLPFPINCHVTMRYSSATDDWFWAGKHPQNELENSVTLFPVSSHGHKSDAAILSMYAELFPPSGDDVEAMRMVNRSTILRAQALSNTGCV